MSWAQLSECYIIIGGPEQWLLPGTFSTESHKCQWSQCVCGHVIIVSICVMSLWSQCVCDMSLWSQCVCDMSLWSQCVCDMSSWSHCVCDHVIMVHSMSCDMPSWSQCVTCLHGRCVCDMSLWSVCLQHVTCTFSRTNPSSQAWVSAHCFREPCAETLAHEGWTSPAVATQKVRIRTLDILRGLSSQQWWSCGEQGTQGVSPPCWGGVGLPKEMSGCLFRHCWPDFIFNTQWDH